jgi:hypothetical protein
MQEIPLGEIEEVKTESVTTTLAFESSIGRTIQKLTNLYSRSNLWAFVDKKDTLSYCDSFDGEPGWYTIKIEGTLPGPLHKYMELFSNVEFEGVGLVKECKIESVYHTREGDITKVSGTIFPPVIAYSKRQVNGLLWHNSNTLCFVSGKDQSTHVEVLVQLAEGDNNSTVLVIIVHLKDDSVFCGTIKYFFLERIVRGVALYPQFLRKQK